MEYPAHLMHPQLGNCLLVSNDRISGHQQPLEHLAHIPQIESVMELLWNWQLVFLNSVVHFYRRRCDDLRETFDAFIECICDEKGLQNLIEDVMQCPLNGLRQT